MTHELPHLSQHDLPGARLVRATPLLTVFAIAALLLTAFVFLTSYEIETNVGGEGVLIPAPVDRSEPWIAILKISEPESAGVRIGASARLRASDPADLNGRTFLQAEVLRLDAATSISGAAPSETGSKTASVGLVFRDVYLQVDRDSLDATANESNDVRPSSRQSVAIEGRISTGKAPAFHFLTRSLRGTDAR